MRIQVGYCLVNVVLEALEPARPRRASGYGQPFRTVPTIWKSLCGAHNVELC